MSNLIVAAQLSIIGNACFKAYNQPGRMSTTRRTFFNLACNLVDTSRILQGYKLTEIED